VIGAPAHEPLSHWSFCVQASPSSQAVVSAAMALLHIPVAGSQMDSRHCSSAAGHTFTVDPVQTFALQTPWLAQRFSASPLHASPSRGVARQAPVPSQAPSNPHVSPESVHVS
jgi:hypothetical protein